MHGGHTHSHSHSVSCNTPTYGSEHARLLRLASYASVSVALVLIALKGGVWWMSDSLSMLSSLTDSLFDVATSIINLLALRYALKPADDDHRYGHTGIEDIAGLAQFTFIVGSVLVIMLQSIERLFHPEPLQHELWGLAVSCIGAILTLALVSFQSRVVARTGSVIIASDRAHYVSDILFNLGVMAAFGVSLATGVRWADPVCALMIAAVVLYATRDIGKRAFDNLMNRELPDAERAAMIAAAMQCKGVTAVVQLRTRALGAKALVDMVVAVEGATSLEQAHATAKRVEAVLMADRSQADIVVRPQPA